MFRRKQLPPELDQPYRAFAEQVREMEEARDALMSCLPVGRVDPAPVPVGLDLLSDVLGEVRQRMDLWRVPEVADEWQACADAIEESLGNMPRAHEVAETSGELEDLLGAVEDVDEPLGYAFQQAELRFRRLRR